MSEMLDKSIPERIISRLINQIRRIGMRTLSAIFTAAVVLLALAACTPNQPPTTPVIEVSDTTVYAGSEVSLLASSDDPDNDPLSWKWQASAGTLSASDQPSVIWTAPEVSDTSTVIINLVVSDSKDAKASASQEITAYPRPESGLEVSIGDTTREDSTHFFDGSAYGYYRRQMLYYGSEIKKSGTLIKFSIMPTMSGTGIFNNFVVYMAEVSRIELESGFAKNYEGKNPELVLYNSSLTYEAGVDSWFDFDLSSPFAYDSTRNLLIEVIWNLNDGHIIRNWGFSIPGVVRSTGSQYEDADNGQPSQTLPYIKLTFEK